MSEPLSAEELERVRAGGSTPRLIATIDALTAERDLAYDTGYDAGRSSVEKWAGEQVERADAAEAQVERLTAELTIANLIIRHLLDAMQNEVTALASEGSSDE